MGKPHLSKVFLKYFIIYFSCFLSILIFCITMMQLSYNSVKQYVIRSGSTRLSEGVEALEGDIMKANMAAQIISQDQSFGLLNKTTDKLPKDQALSLKYVQEQFGGVEESMSDDDGVIIPYGFLFFNNNNYIVTTTNCSDNYERYFKNFLKVTYKGESISAMQFKELLKDKTQKLGGYIKLDKFGYVGGSGKQATISGGVLFLTSSPTNPNTNFAFIISPKALLARLMEKDTRDAGYIKVMHGNQVLFDYPNNRHTDKGDISKNFYVLKRSSADVGWQVEIGIGKSVIREQTRMMRLMLLIYCLIGLFGIFVITLVLSLRQYRGIKSLFSSFSGREMKTSGFKNEYRFLNDIIKNMTKENKDYRLQIEDALKENRVILLQDLIVRGIVSAGAKDALYAYFGKEPETFCVTVINVPEVKEKIQLILMYVTEELDRQTGRANPAVQTSDGEIAIIVSLDASEQPTVRHVEEKISGILQEMMKADAERIYQVGISAIGIGIDNVHICYNQAEQVLLGNASENESFVRSYNLDMNSVRDNYVNLEFLNKFYRLLISAQSGELAAMLEKMSGYYKKMPAQFAFYKMQVFYSIQNVIQTACLNYPKELFAALLIPAFSSEYTPDRFAKVWEEVTGAFCTILRGFRQSEDEELKVKIVRYIDENFRKPELNISMVCRVNKVTQKYVNDAVKESTNESFTSYLEKVRVAEAGRLLSATELSNERIAELTGFGAVNTFYRVFRKCMDMTPKNYRELHAGDAAVKRVK